MCFNQRGDISTLNGSSLKLVDKFPYLGSSVSSNGTDINTRLVKAWTAIDRLSVKWESDQTDKIKRSFFSKQWSCRYYYMDALHGRLLNVRRKSLTATTQECCEQYWTSSGGNTPQNSSYTATHHPSWKLSTLEEPVMRDTVGEVRTNSLATYSCWPLHMDEQKQDDQLEPINSSVPIQDIALKTSREQWTIETGGERGWGRSMLTAWHDDDDDDDDGFVSKLYLQLNYCRQDCTRRPIVLNWL